MAEPGSTEWLESHTEEIIDPDRPIITGRVYNADHIVPQEFPEPKIDTKKGKKPKEFPSQGKLSNCQ